MRQFKVLSVFLLILIIAGCGAFQGQQPAQPMSPRQNYYTALKMWNDQFSTYLNAYEAAGPETKASWKKNIDPIVRAADQAIHVWGSSFGTADEAAKYQLWTDARNQALALLLGSGILKVEEVK